MVYMVYNGKYAMRRESRKTIYIMCILNINIINYYVICLTVSRLCELMIRIIIHKYANLFTT